MPRTALAPGNAPRCLLRSVAVIGTVWCPSVADQVEPICRTASEARHDGQAMFRPQADESDSVTPPLDPFWISFCTVSRELRLAFDYKVNRERYHLLIALC